MPFEAATAVPAVGSAQIQRLPCRSVEFPFAHRQRVRYGETDLQGVVYYANYLLFAEVGRVAYLRALDVVYDRDFIAKGLDFTIGEARVRYRVPLRFDEEYTSRCGLARSATRRGRSSTRSIARTGCTA